MTNRNRPSTNLYSHSYKSPYTRRCNPNNCRRHFRRHFRHLRN